MIVEEVKETKLNLPSWIEINFKKIYKKHAHINTAFKLTCGITENSCTQEI